MRVLSIFILIFFLTGCVQNRSYGIFKQDNIYQKAIKHTKKAEILNSSQTKVILIATYLTPIYPKFKKDEYFYLRVYANEINSSENRGLINNNYKISLNSKEAISVRELKKENDYKNELPFNNDWFKGYIAKFPNLNQKDLNLTYEDKNYGKMVLEFSKNL